MKEKFKMAAEKAGTQPEKTGSTLENVKETVEGNTTDLLKKARKTEILEEVKAKLGISTKKEKDLLQRTDHILTHAKDHVEVRTEQWVKEVGLKKDKLVNDLGNLTNPLPGKVKKSEPFTNVNEKTGVLKKNTRHTMKMVARKVVTKN